jgi:polyhydroxyalkanoate synthesis regulator phasin
MQDKDKAQELFSQFAGKTIETMAVWAEANQRLLREMVELSTGTAKEGVRLYSELSRSAIEAVRDHQASAQRWQAIWKEASGDPTVFYQKALNEGVQYTQQAFHRAEESVQALTRAAERLHSTAEQAGKGLQESLSGAVSRLKETYATTN